MLKLSKMGVLVLAVTGFGAGHAATVNATIAGWNLMGYSDAADVVVADAFGDNAKVTTVWKWVATTSRWAFYSPDLPDGGQAYAGTKGYDFLTTIKSGDGFWVNSKAIFSATLPAVAAPVNQAALSGITSTLSAFQALFASSLPSSTNTNLAGLVDDSMLMGGATKTQFLQSVVTPGNGPNVGAQFGNAVLVNPRDAGAQPNDATHQWFTFDVTPGGGPENAWLAIKNASGNWLLAGDQRLFDFSVNAQSVKHVPVVGSVSFNNQVNVNLDKLPAGVSQVWLTGAGVAPATGIAIYSTANGQIFPQTCGVNNTTNCIDPAAALAGAAYTVKAYTTAGGTNVLAYTYTSVLNATPLAVANLSTAAFANITGVTGTWAPSTDVSVTWTLPSGAQANWINVNAWPSTGGQLFNNVGFNLTSSQTSAKLTLPNYSGTISGKNVWLETRDASGNRLAVDYQQ